MRSFAARAPASGSATVRWGRSCCAAARNARLSTQFTILNEKIAELTREIVARRTAEEALRESERQFRMLVNSIPTLAWMAQPDGWIVWYNRRWYEYTGTTPEQMEGWGWQSVHDPETLPSVLERWRHSIATGEPFEMVFPLRGADGVFRPFLTRVVPVRDQQGQVVRWFGTNTDITEQRAAEDTLRRLNELLEETRRRRGRAAHGGRGSAAAVAEDGGDRSADGRHRP